METFWTILGGCLLVLGFIGCVIPVIPGPLLGFAALLALLPTAYALSTSQLVLAGGVVFAAILLDYVVPALGAKKFHCSRWGVFGCMVGTIVGVFTFPWGMLLGPFVGAFLGELVAGKSAGAALRGGFGAFIGFLASVVLKFAAVGLLAYWFIRAVSA